MPNSTPMLRSPVLVSRVLAAASAGLLLAACGGDSPTGSTTSVLPCPVDGDGGQLLSLQVGDVQTVDDPAALACLKLGAGAGNYVFVAANANETQDRLNDYLVRSEASGSSSADVHAPGMGGHYNGAASGSLDLRRDLGIDHRIRAFERRRLDPDRAPVDTRGRALRRVDGGAGYSAAAAGSAVASPSVNGASLSVSGIDGAVRAATAELVEGDKIPLRVPKFDDTTPNNLCDNPIQITGTVKKVTRTAILVSDDASPSGGFTDTDYAAIGAEFDDLIHATDTTYFGTPTDIDANQKIIILYTPEVNKLTPKGSQGYVGGFFFGGDLFTTAECAQSNERELFYLLTPDPNGTINDNVRTTSQVRQGTRGTIAHEFQHMINLGMKIKAPFQAQNEEVWLNEALSHLAEELVGRRRLGVGDFAELDWSDVSANLQDLNAFFWQNFARFNMYLVNPQGSSVASDSADRGLSYRGGSWAMLRHAADHHAGGDLAAFTRALVYTPRIGIPNMEFVTGQAWDDLFRGFMVALYADNLGIANLAPTYSFRSWNMRDAMQCYAYAAKEGSASCATPPPYPLKVTALANATSQSLKVRSSSGAFFSRSSGASASTFQLLQGPTGSTQVTSAGAKTYVLRVQ